MVARLSAAVAPCAAFVLEMLVVVAVATAGVLAAAVLALGPWRPAHTMHPPVVRFEPPTIAIHAAGPHRSGRGGPAAG